MEWTADQVEQYVNLFITKSAAADAIGVSRTTLYTMLERGADKTQTKAMIQVTFEQHRLIQECTEYFIPGGPQDHAREELEEMARDAKRLASMSGEELRAALAEEEWVLSAGDAKAAMTSTAEWLQECVDERKANALANIKDALSDRYHVLHLGDYTVFRLKDPSGPFLPGCLQLHPDLEKWANASWSERSNQWQKGTLFATGWKVSALEYVATWSDIEGVFGNYTTKEAPDAKTARELYNVILQAY